MAANPAFAAKTAADSTYTASIADGASTTLTAHDLTGHEAIIITVPDAGGTYIPLTYQGEKAVKRTASMTERNNTLKLNGPLDFKIEKPVTTNAVEVTVYS